MYIAIDPRTCKECKAVFCYNCTLGACFEEGCCRDKYGCPMGQNKCPVCLKDLYSRYDFQALDDRQMARLAVLQANRRPEPGMGGMGGMGGIMPEENHGGRMEVPPPLYE